MRPVQCPKCQAWCLLALVDGFKAAVDVLPATPESYRATLIAGRSTYALTGREGRVMRLISGPTAQYYDWAVRRNEHACGNRAFSDFPVKAPEAALSESVCDSRRRGGWIPPAGCPRAVQPLSAAGQKSCDQCEPPPFDSAGASQAVDVGMDHAVYLLTEMLGATVVE